MPGAVWKLTVSFAGAGRDREMVNSAKTGSPPLPSSVPSVTWASDTETAGGVSSLTIVPVPTAPPPSPTNVTVNVSSGSFSVSPSTATRIVPCVSPAGMTKVPSGTAT